MKPIPDHLHELYVCSEGYHQDNHNVRKRSVGAIDTDIALIELRSLDLRVLDAADTI